MLNIFSKKKLKIETSGEKKGKVLLVNNVWDEEEVRKELSSVVIMHEYPLSIVEHGRFRRYSKALNSSFKMTQGTLSRAIFLKCLNMKNPKQ